jgi:aminomuconate-semialdehyde/2-hydroxymuconate-6-semialdehyde dehydrogenase
MNTDLPHAEAQALDLIKNLQSSKAAQENFKKKPLPQRAEYLKKLAESISIHKLEISKDIATEQKLPLSFVEIELVDSLQKYLENLYIEVSLFNQPNARLPVGVVAATLHHTLLFPRLLQIVASVIASGNSLIVNLPVSGIVSLKWCKKILELSDVPTDLIQFLSGNTSEISGLLAGHPGLSAYIYYGPTSQAQGFMTKAMQRQKKVQFFMDAKNSCLVHPDFDFEKNISQILQPFLIGQGQLDINCHRLFISQNVEKKFYEVLKEEMNRLQKSRTIEDKSPWTELGQDQNLQSWKKSVAQVPADSGKILWGGNWQNDLFVQPTWTQDLSNCSEMQQHHIPAPLFIVTAVKYTHEMVKWSNTGYLGHSAVIWGPVEKALSLGSQLQVGHVHINRWTDFLSMGTPIKQSFWGNPDLKWSGSFYSDVKKM